MREANLGNLDRGDKTKEQLEAEMSPEALALVEQMKTSTVENYARNQKAEGRFYRKNRKAWDRMNRPEKLKAIERGSERILNLVNGVGFVTDEEIVKEIPV